MRKKWKGGSKKRIPPDGTVRQSQLVTTFGPGSLMDLVDHAVLVGGLDFWSFDKAKGLPVIHEPRLRDAIAQRLEDSDRKLSVEKAFLAPPVGDDQEPSKFSGVQVLQFPSWMVCQNPDCRALVRSNGLETKGGRYYHQCTGSKPSLAVPVRFVGACKQGHVTDFPWIYFTHRDYDMCAAANLRLLEGASGDFSEVKIVCSCGAFAWLSNALATEANPPCPGHRPWLGTQGKEECSERLRLLVRTASNAYFAQVVSALSIPEKDNAIDEAVQGLWNYLQKVTDEAKLALVREMMPEVEAGLAGTSNADALAAIEARRKGKTPERKPLRTAEFDQFVSQPEEIPGELPGADDDFFARTVAAEQQVDGVEQVVLASKVREVRTQIGFTRLEPATPDLQGEYDLGVQSAPLGLVTDWLPASEIRGEGVFIRLAEKTVVEWEARSAVKKRGEELLAGYEQWALGYESPPPFPGTRFYMLHSLSHLLISGISLECGYAASAISERIYCAPAGDDAMAAILLSTGSSGSEGTLGGLVEQGRDLRLHLRRAYDLGVLCSNDPVCAGHSPEKDYAERYLEGAACHGCLYIAECSCERFNRYLDRALVVPTIGHDPALAFFSERP
jgi:MrfA Zn-binding domain